MGGPFCFCLLLRRSAGETALTGCPFAYTLFDKLNNRMSECETAMPDAIGLQAVAELLKAFSHATRLAILQELIAGPKCVTDMEELLPARQANISQHLAVLRHTKLVDYAQDGALRCYYLCRPRLVQDMLALVGRNEPVVKRTPEEIRADKERLDKALQRKPSTNVSKQSRGMKVPG